jgi:hypothetical protein
MVGCRAPKSPCDPPKKTDVDRLVCRRDRLTCVGDILRASSKAFHGNEIFATDHTQSAAMEWNVNGSTERVGIKTPKPGQEVDAVAVTIANRQQSGNRLSVRSAHRRRREAEALIDLEPAFS